MKIETIDIQAKEWFDKVNGNSYFSAVATINFGLPDVKEVKLPFQYGYGDHYMYKGFKAIEEAGLITDAEKMEAPHRYCERKGIILRYSKQEKCKQRDVKAFGL